MHAFAHSPRHLRCSLLCCALPLLWALSGCASSDAGGGLVDKSLEALGLKKPELPGGLTAPPLPQLDKKVVLRIHAGEQLNTGTNGRSLSVVVRIYRLKEPATFLRAPYDAFRTPAAEKEAFGTDLAEVREVVLTPGQKSETVETMARSAPFLGVVALFRAPAQGRWRFAFDANSAEKTGVTLGVHGCALSVATGEPVDTPPEALRLAGVVCK
jgi:type VI secretion system protein VasD